ncbi:hypothetical protein [Alkalinema sp. FACHB-956]|uniref:hypothetical protein n=1 Tax=Alkalinema sp. FACHB-956 TaxID=2692768 RepID=UPI0016886E21|nr:hypothetical protein [Alkalinema sp. FACHB-956]MBD2328963.1 hypothetical protein [Alkalinema sp. FACHB-956]
MKKSYSWEGFESWKKGESKLETISLLYSYDLGDADAPSDVRDFLIALEERFGGSTYPVIRLSGDNYLSVVTPSVGILVSFIVAPLVRKYLDGFFNGDGLKELGETHREEITLWFSKLEQELDVVVAATNDLLQEYPETLICRRQRTDLILETNLGESKLSIALNRHHSQEIRAAIPSSIVNAIKYLIENPPEGHLGNFTLHYDSSKKKWLIHVTNVIDFSG